MESSRGAARGLVLILVATLTALAPRSEAGRPVADGVGPEVRARFEQRLARCGATDLDAQVELTDWAAAQGLRDEADDLLRRVLAVDPDHADAYASLVKLTASHTLTSNSTAYRDARKLLPPRFLEYETKNFVVLSDAHPNWSRNQAGRLERTYHQFVRFARRLGAKPQPLKHRLVCVLFRDREDYQRFGRRHDEVTDVWIAGYYAPVNDRIVFYHGEDNPSVVEARVKLAEMQVQLAEISEAANRAHHSGNNQHAEALDRQRRTYHQHLIREQSRIDSFADQVSVATTVHESIHQLLFHTAVQSWHIQYPLWISEGLATAFETDATNQAFGPEFEYEPREEEFRKLLEQDALLDLRTLVSMTRVPVSETQEVHAIYHQSYALVRWIYRFRRAELRDFLQRMRKERHGAISEARYAEIFEGSFGKIEAVQRSWLRYERSRDS